MLRITLDTNVLISGLDQSDSAKRDVFAKLRLLEKQGYIQLALTSRFDRDKEDDQDIERVKRHYRVARDFSNLGGPFRIGVSAIGGLDGLVGGDEPDFQAVFGITDPTTANPHTLSDVDHLFAHWRAGYDYFLTYDRPVLKKAGKLRELGVTVISPDSFTHIASQTIEQYRDTPTDICEQLKLAFVALGSSPAR
jgi:hypothetical protein